MAITKRKKRVAKTTHYVKLYAQDQTYLKNEVETRKSYDEEFKTMVTAIRRYVHIGIAAEISTTDIRKSLENSIVKKSQKEAVRTELQPLVSDLQQVFNMLSLLNKNLNDFTTEQSLTNTKLETKLDQIESQMESENKTINSTLKNIVDLVFASQKDSDSLLRNILILRTVLYVLLLMERQGKLTSEEFNMKKWANLITSIHQKTEPIPHNLLEQFSNIDFEKSLIQDIGREIFSKEKFAKT